MTGYLQASAVLPEGSLDLQLLLNGGVSQLGPVPLHLCCSAEGALQPPGLVLHLLQLTLQAVKLWLTLHSQGVVVSYGKWYESWAGDESWQVV